MGKLIKINGKISKFQKLIVKGLFKKAKQSKIFIPHKKKKKTIIPNMYMWTNL